MFYTMVFGTLFGRWCLSGDSTKNIVGYRTKVHTSQGGQCKGESESQKQDKGEEKGTRVGGKHASRGGGRG